MRRGKFFAPPGGASTDHVLAGEGGSSVMESVTTSVDDYVYKG